jgi:hypothetical protein
VQLPELLKKPARHEDWQPDGESSTLGATHEMQSLAEVDEQAVQLDEHCPHLEFKESWK